MSMIGKLQRLESEYIMNELKNCYGHYFPMEVRLNLAEFLEKRLVNVNENQLALDEIAKIFVKDFLVEIERKAAEFHENDSTRFRFLELHRALKADSNATRIYSHLINCMIFEQKLLYQATHATDNVSDQVTQSVYHLGKLVRRNEDLKADLIRQWHGYQEDYQKVSQEYYNSNTDNTEQHEFAGMFYSMEKDRLDFKFNKLIADCNVIVDDVNNVTNIAHNLVCRVIDDFLKQWQWNSKFNGVNIVLNGATLDDIQSWCERLAMALWTTMEQVRVLLAMTKAELPNLQHYIHTFMNLDRKLAPTLVKLVHDSLIVEQQPSQVIHSQTKFSAGVRLLIGKSLGKHFAYTDVKVELLAENQAGTVAGSMNQSVAQPKNKILNSTSNLEFSEAENTMIATFRNMRFERYKRPNRKQTDSVTDEKSALCFHTTINVGNLSISIKKQSLPVVIIVSTSQEAQAKATIFWDNSFGHIDRMPFFVPDKVTWSQLAEALNREMTSYGGRGLSEQNLHFLSTKLLRSQPANANDLVSWSLFCKENLPDQEFTFWYWFHSALKLTSKYLEPWKDGSIVGFISRTEAERCLSVSAEGTFLLRFSETTAGTISIAANLRNPCSNVASVFHLQPFGDRHFGTRSLFEILNDLVFLSFLFPNTPKAAAFDRYKPGWLVRQETRRLNYAMVSARFDLVWIRPPW